VTETSCGRAFWPKLARKGATKSSFDAKMCVARPPRQRGQPGRQLYCHVRQHSITTLLSRKPCNRGVHVAPREDGESWAVGNDWLAGAIENDAGLRVDRTKKHCGLILVPKEVADDEDSGLPPISAFGGGFREEQNARILADDCCELSMDDSGRFGSIVHTGLMIERQDSNGDGPGRSGTLRVLHREAGRGNKRGKHDTDAAPHHRRNAA